MPERSLQPSHSAHEEPVSLILMALSGKAFMPSVVNSNRLKTFTGKLCIWTDLENVLSVVAQKTF